MLSKAWQLFHLSFLNIYKNYLTKVTLNVSFEANGQNKTIL